MRRGNPLISSEIRSGFILWVTIPATLWDGILRVAKDIDEIFRQELATLLPRLRRAARGKAASYINPGDTADEMIGAACERAWKNRHQWSGKNFVAWFLTIFDHCLADEAERRNKHRMANPAETERLLNTSDPHATAAFEGVISRDSTALIRQHVTEEQWKTAYLVLVLDYTNPEAAKILEVPLGTVKSRVHAVRTVAQRLVVR